MARDTLPAPPLPAPPTPTERPIPPIRKVSDAQLMAEIRDYVSRQLGIARRDGLDPADAAVRLAEVSSRHAERVARARLERDIWKDKIARLDMGKPTEIAAAPVDLSRLSDEELDAAAAIAAKVRV